MTMMFSLAVLFKMKTNIANKGKIHVPNAGFNYFPDDKKKRTDAETNWQTD